MELPKTIKDFLQSRIVEGFSEETCKACTKTCCTGSGFAILENILEIHKIYSNEGLRREDYVFDKGLSLRDFICKYFDRVTFNNAFLAFFPKCLTRGNELISIPPWNYYAGRDYIQNRKENFGCVFLNKKSYKDVNGYRCILHNNDSMARVTQKPIDCVFLTCDEKGQIIKPKLNESNLWFALLDYHFPNSRDRFLQLCPNMPD